jgi:hypothetical protein
VHWIDSYGAVSALVVASEVHPVVLCGHGHHAEKQAADDDRCQGIGASPAAGQRLPHGRQVLGRPAQCRLQIDDHVHAEKQEPDHRSRTVQVARDLEPSSPQHPHRDTAAEEHHRCRNEERSQ